MAAERIVNWRVTIDLDGHTIGAVSGTDKGNTVIISVGANSIPITKSALRAIAYALGEAAEEAGGTYEFFPDPR